MGEERGNIPVCLKAIGLEVPHMAGATVWQQWHVHQGNTCLQKATPKRGTLPNCTPRPTPEERALMRANGTNRTHVGAYHRWHYRFHTLALPSNGLVLPCTTLHGMRFVFWLQLYDPLPYTPICYLLLSEPVWHPLHKCVKWRTHTHWTLACLWPNCTRTVEETGCGCGVRLTVGF